MKKSIPHQDFDTNKYKVCTWKNWVVLHWILNPGMAINELLFGQRVPKISLEDITIDKPRIERTIVPCPHCGSLHDARIWSNETSTGFRNWYGFYCIKCGKIIPCVRNIFSLVILVITFPIWGWFRESLKEKWLAKQPKRYENINIENIPNSFDDRHWLLTGLVWGSIMFVIITILYPYFQGHKITVRSLFIGFIIWTVGGLVFGYIMKVIMNKKPNKRI